MRHLFESFQSCGGSGRTGRFDGKEGRFLYTMHIQSASSGICGKGKETRDFPVEADTAACGGCGDADSRNIVYFLIKMKCSGVKFVEILY